MSEKFPEFPRLKAYKRIPEHIEPVDLRLSRDYEPHSLRTRFTAHGMSTTGGITQSVAREIWLDESMWEPDEALELLELLAKVVGKRLGTTVDAK